MIRSGAGILFDWQTMLVMLLVQLSEQKMITTTEGTWTPTIDRMIMVNLPYRKTNNSGGDNLSDGQYNRITASKSIGPNDNKTITISGLQSGWMKVAYSGWI